MPNEEDAERGFKVEDKRRFDDEGNERREPAADGGTTEAGATADQSATDAAADSSPVSHSSAPSITFSSFVVGLATQALSFLGAIGGADGEETRNLDEAAALIDILAMLKDKTTSNLAEDEERLIEEVLYDLRMRFVAERSTASEKGDNK